VVSENGRALHNRVDPGERQRYRGPGEQGHPIRRLDAEEGGFQVARSEVGTALGGSSRRYRQLPGPALQFGQGLSELRGGGLLYPGLVRGQQLGRPAILPDSLAAIVDRGAGRPSNADSSQVGVPAVVAPAAQPRLRPPTSQFSVVPAGPLRFRRAVEESDVGLRSGEDSGSDEEEGSHLIERLISAAQSKATHKKYNGLWAQFSSSCASKSVSQLPASTPTVLSFIADLHQTPSKVSSLRTFITVIRQRHVEAGYPDPTASPLVAKAVEGALRLAAQDKNWPRERDPFPVESLREWLARPPSLNPFLWARNAALVSLGLRTMFRAAELVKIKLGDIRPKGDGIEVRVGPSKADQNAKRRPVFVDPSGFLSCPVALTQALIAIRRGQGALDADLLFSDAAGRPLSPSAVSSIVKNMVDHSGIEGFFSGHSLRIGGASAALAAGFTVDEVMTLGAWKSDAVRQYLMPLVTRRRDVSGRFGL